MNNDDVPELTPDSFLQPRDVNYVGPDETHIAVGDDIGLSTKDPLLKKIKIAAGWDVKSMEGTPPDIDLSCILLDKKNQTRVDEDFVFYNCPSSTNAEVVHKHDSLTGAGDGDDEWIEIDLQALHFDINSILVILSVHEGDLKEEDFTLIKNLFFRITNLETDQELCRLIIPETLLAECVKTSAIPLGSIFRDGPKWRYHSDINVTPKENLRTLATQHGLLIL